MNMGVRDTIEPVIPSLCSLAFQNYRYTCSSSAGLLPRVPHVNLVLDALFSGFSARFTVWGISSPMSPISPRGNPERYFPCLLVVRLQARELFCASETQSCETLIQEGGIWGRRLGVDTIFPARVAAEVNGFQGCRSCKLTWVLDWKGQHYLAQ